MASLNSSQTCSRSRAKQSRRRVRFERHPSQVMFDPELSKYVVTWSKCGKPDHERLAYRRDPMTWVPSIGAVAALFDRGCVPEVRIVDAAKAIGEAWSLGDRDGLDTCDAKQAAELVHDLSSMCVDRSSPSVALDVRHAMIHLVDEMSHVAFMNLEKKELEDGVVIPPLEKAMAECVGLDGFSQWPNTSRRKRFLYCLNRKERTQVAYTMAALLFGTGSCPLLSRSDERTLRAIAMRESEIGSSTDNEVVAFLKSALSRMRSAKELGRNSIVERMTQKQLADSLVDSFAN